MFRRQQAGSLLRLQRLASLPLQAAAAGRTKNMSATTTAAAAKAGPVDPRTGKAPRLPLLQREDCTPEQAEIFDRVTSSEPGNRRPPAQLR